MCFIAKGCERPRLRRHSEACTKRACTYKPLEKRMSSYCLFFFYLSTTAQVSPLQYLQKIHTHTHKLEDCVLLLNHQLQFPLWCSFSFVLTERLLFDHVKSCVGTTGHNLGSVKVTPAAAFQGQASCSGSLDMCQGISVVLVKC